MLLEKKAHLLQLDTRTLVINLFFSKLPTCISFYQQKFQTPQLRRKQYSQSLVCKKNSFSKKQLAN